MLYGAVGASAVIFAIGAAWPTGDRSTGAGRWRRRIRAGALVASGSVIALVVAWCLWFVIGTRDGFT